MIPDSNADLMPEDTRPDGAPCAALEDVLITAELATRPARAPDYRAENEALVSLATTLAQSPQSILQKLVDTALGLCRAGSAGISLEERVDGEDIFRWRATAGQLGPYLGGTLPRRFSPCGVTVDEGKAQLMRDPVNFYPYIAGLNIPIREVLLVPFYFRTQIVGTIWIVSHVETPDFDAEDARLVGNLAQFASAATESLAALEEAEKAKERLQEVGTKLEAALDAGFIGTWSWDVIHDRVTSDAQFAKLFPIGKTDAEGGPISAYVEAIHPDDRERVQAQIAEALRLGRVYESEYRVRQTDASYRWVLARGKALVNEEGKPLHFPGVIVDVTERKIAQLDHEKQQRELWAALPVAVYTLDTEGTLTFYNDAAVRLWERTPQTGKDKWGGAQALLSMDGTPLSHADSPAAVAVRERRSMRGIELFVVRPDGSRRWIVPHPDPVFDSSGAFRGIVNVLFDVTEERQARAALFKVRDQAIASSRAKDEFLAALSHELRTPLNPALLLASDAASNPDYPAQVREDFQNVRKNIELEARLIDDLLDITRITRGLMKLERSIVDLHGIVREAAQKVQADAEAKNLTILWNLPEGAALVDGDSARLQQVFWNVLKNAVKFTPLGGSIRIESVPSKAEKKVRIQVWDTGIGLEGDELSRVFDAFVQGSHAEKGGHLFGGLGLGLAISHKVMEMHDGRITASSAGRGQGATFTMEIPLAEAEDPAGATADMAGKKPSEEPGRPGFRILIVEDNDDTRHALQRLLGRRGHAVETANCGAAACVLAAAHPFDLAICDVGLPDIDGYTLLGKIHALQPGLPAIAMTGYGTVQDVEQADKAGFWLHMTKPVSASRLQEAIVEIAGRMG